MFYCCVLPSSLALLTLPQTPLPLSKRPPTASNGARSEPTLEEKKAAYAALAKSDVAHLATCMGRWGRNKNLERSKQLHLPVTILLTLIIDLLLAFTLFIGQIVSENYHSGNRTIAYQQGLFLNTFALIEFFKTLLRLIFCPRFPTLRFFHLSDARASYQKTHLQLAQRHLRSMYRWPHWSTCC